MGELCTIGDLVADGNGTASDRDNDNYPAKEQRDARNTNYQTGEEDRDDRPGKRRVTGRCCGTGSTIVEQKFHMRECSGHIIIVSFISSPEFTSS